MSDWQPKKGAAKALLCSTRTIEELCSHGVLIAGKHYYAAGVRGGSLVFHVERCREALLKHTAARKKVESDTYDEAHLDQLIKETKTNC